jgi:outer membrane protein
MMMPRISANTYLSYGDYGNILGTAPGVMPANLYTVPAQGFADQNLTLMAPIYTGGSLENLVRASTARVRAVVADGHATEADTVERIREAYYRALLGGQLRGVAQARLDAGREIVRTAQALFAAGKGLEASVRRAEAEQADAERMLATVRNAQAKALLDLKALMGVDADQDFSLTDDLAFVPPAGDLTAHLAAARERRPELRAVRERNAAAGAQVRSSRGAQGAQIYATVMTDGFTSRPLGTREGYTVGLVVSLPLLDGGQRRAETAQAQAQQERVIAEARDLELRVATEVREAWLDVETATENYHTARVALLAAQAAYDVTTLRVQNQKGLLVEQLDALAALTQVRGSLAQALYDYADARARLDRAVGRGW